MQINGEPGQQKGQRIGRIVTGIGNKRKTVGTQAEEDFNYNEGTGREKRPNQHRPRGWTMMMVPGVIVISSPV